jgi:hypothetical protein
MPRVSAAAAHDRTGRRRLQERMFEAASGGCIDESSLVGGSTPVSRKQSTSGAAARHSPAAAPGVRRHRRDGLRLLRDAVKLFGQIPGPSKSRLTDSRQQ